MARISRHVPFLAALIAVFMATGLCAQAAGVWWTELFREDFEQGYSAGQQLTGRGGLGAGVVAVPNLPAIGSPDTDMFFRLANTGFSQPLSGMAANLHWSQSPQPDGDVYSTFLVTQPLPMGYAQTELYFDASIDLKTSGLVEHRLKVWVSTDSGVSFVLAGSVATTVSLSPQTFFVDLTQLVQGSGDFLLAFEASGYDTTNHLNGFTLDNILVLGSVAANPIADPYEPNDIPDFAYDFGNPPFSAAAEVSVEDNDYFKWWTPGAGSTWVTIAATGDIRAELYRILPDSHMKLTLVDQLAGGTGNRLQHYSTDGTGYVLRVTTPDPWALADLQFEFCNGPDCTIDDSHEDNDSAAQALHIGTAPAYIAGLLSWHQDDDWFALDIGPATPPSPGLGPDVLRIEIEQSGTVIRPLIAQLVRNDPAAPMTTVATSVPLTGLTARIEHVIPISASNCEYFVRVFSNQSIATQAGMAYDLRVSRLPSQSGGAIVQIGHAAGAGAEGDILHLPVFASALNPTHQVQYTSSTVLPGSYSLDLGTGLLTWVPPGGSAVGCWQ